MPPRDPNGRSSLIRSSCTQEDRHLVGFDGRYERRASDGETPDLASRRHVALHQRGRERQHVCHVVEAVLVDIVARQQRADLHIEREQVADGVPVLGPVEAVECLCAARIRPRRVSAVELGLEPRRERLVGLRIRARAADGGHPPGAQLRSDLFPHLRALGDLLDVRRVQREPRGAESFVVAGDAVAVEDRAVRGCALRHRRGPRGPRLWRGDR